nr:MAG TPA: hypothetical protein [Inoviridae sp.]
MPAFLAGLFRVLMSYMGRLLATFLPSLKTLFFQDACFSRWSF